jgi:hypothetical protein
MRLVAPLGVLALLAGAQSAAATPSARLVYARTAEAATCPDETALRKAVAARFGYDPFFAWARQTVVVQIWNSGGRYAARVQLLDEEGLARGTREIVSDDDSCSELFDAAALAISIALDASAKTPAPPPVADVAPPPEPVPPALRPSPTADTPTRQAPLAVTTVAPSPFRIGLDAVASVLVAPNPLGGIAVFADYRSRAFSFGLEIQAQLSLPADEHPPRSVPSLAHVESALSAATLAPCVHYERAVVCALGEIGWTQAWGWGLASRGSEGAPFVAAGARLGADWPLTRGLFARVHADLLANLNRVSYEVDSQEVWPANPVVAAFGVGLGGPFP